MAYLLEALGRGLPAELYSLLAGRLPLLPDDEPGALAARLAHSPNSLDLTLRLATAQLRCGRYAAARDAYRGAARLRGDSPQPHIGLACVHDACGSAPAETLGALLDAQARDPQDPDTAYAAGVVHERLAERAEAAAAYARALERDRSHRGALQRLAALSLCDADMVTALSHYEQLAEDDPGDLDTLLTLGALNLAAARGEAAVERFQQALFVEPECDEPDNLGDLDDPDQLAGAIAAIEQMATSRPAAAPLHVQLGDLYVRAGNDYKAVTAYRSALDTQPNFLEATVKLGTQHLRAGRNHDAVLQFCRAIDLNDHLMLAFVGLALAQRASGREAESFATLDLATSLEPSTTLLLSESARLTLQSAPQLAGGRTLTTPEGGSDDWLLQVALHRHEQAERGNPADADVRYRRGVLLRHIGQTRGAIEAYTSALTLNPYAVRAWVKLGVSQRQCGALDDAMRSFERALMLDPRTIAVHYGLALLGVQPMAFERALVGFELDHGQSLPVEAVRPTLEDALRNVGLVDSIDMADALRGTLADPLFMPRREIQLAIRRASL